MKMPPVHGLDTPKRELVLDELSKRLYDTYLVCRRELKWLRAERKRREALAKVHPPDLVPDEWAALP